MSFKGIWTRPRALALAALMAAGLGALAVAAAEHASNANPPATFRYASPEESASRNTFAPVVKRVLPAVVNVSSAKMVKSPMGMMPGNMEPFFRQFFGDDDGAPSWPNVPGVSVTGPNSYATPTDPYCVPVQATDKNNNPLTDAHGNPLYQKNNDGT